MGKNKGKKNLSGADVVQVAEFFKNDRVKVPLCVEHGKMYIGYILNGSILSNYSFYSIFKIHLFI